MENKKRYAPVVVFAFNRREALENLVRSLKKNSEAQYSELFVFVDGARKHKPSEREEVKAVQDYVKTITGFSTIKYTFSEKNKGLANSIIDGVTEVIDRYGKVIVLEDDLVVAPNFLSFMNQGLHKYENESKVFSVCGYSNKVKIPKDYQGDAYFGARSSSWGWATWQDRWHSVDWELNNWNEIRKQKWAFNRWGGSDCWKMLADWHEGRNSSWAIRFCFSQFMQDKLSLFPIVSKVCNNGFDGQGTNCKKWSRFKFVLDKSGKMDFNFPSEVKTEKSIAKSALSYHSIPIRVYSKIMYLIRR